MDTLRGPFDSNPESEDFREFDRHSVDHDEADDLAVENESGKRELPPEAIGQDERRMQVRAYNHWASLLGDGSFPSIEDLEPASLPDFGPNSVLLDFSTGIDDPVVQYLGDRLAAECTERDPEEIIATGCRIDRLSDVPPRSLLSRITDHYMQIIANQAPIGFEAEFVNNGGSAVLYRGILLPFSSDGETIDFVYGVINWKEVADVTAADELLLEIDQALGEDSSKEAAEATARSADPVTDWADSPDREDGDTASQNDATEHADIDPEMNEDADAFDGTASLPDFAQYTLDDPELDENGEEIDEHSGSADDAAYSFASLADYIEAPSKKAIDLEGENFDPEDYRVEDFVQDAAPGTDADDTPHDEDAHEPASLAKPAGQVEAAAEEANDAPIANPEPLPGDADLRDHLASARELANSARTSEDRSRQALYAAVGRAYDFSLAAKEEPVEYDALVEEAGLTVQDRAPMTPIVKLVFGADYDKTRLTEYAAVLTHAHRVGIERGTLPSYLSEAEGGLKGVVNAERRQRREENGETQDTGAVRAALAEKLRELEELVLETMPAEGPEFSLAILRRDEDGRVSLIGEIADDVKLVERAARKLLG
ncbi:MAG: hypothetical protein WA985_03600 [Erythrobacter sp.]